jgi:Trypsin
MNPMPNISTRVAAGIAAHLLSLAAPAQALEKIGKVTQPIVAGTLVSKEDQRKLGLVTINGGCSGTLLNRYWVLTADHCVSADGNIGGPLRLPAQQLITATWSSQRPVVTQVVRYSGAATGGLDVALVLLGDQDFGPVARKLLHHGDVDSSMTLRKYGQGISEYAKGSGPTAVPASGSGRYRTAAFTPSRVSATAIVLPANGAGQVGNGGDSGGPDYVAAGPTGAVMGIASVQSTCAASGYVVGKPQTWMWATGISSCSSASLATIRDDIQRQMQRTPVDLQLAKAGTHGAALPIKPAAPDPVQEATREPAPLTSALTPKAACRPGFVWREARPADLVCVAPAERARTARENAEAAGNTDPKGAYGPTSCRAGYVWREAFSGDAVCVKPQVRKLVKQENAAAASRMAGAALRSGLSSGTAALVP